MGGVSHRSEWPLTANDVVREVGDGQNSPARFHLDEAKHLRRSAGPHGPQGRGDQPLCLQFHTGRGAARLGSRRRTSPRCTRCAPRPPRWWRGSRRCATSFCAALASARRASPRPSLLARPAQPMTQSFIFVLSRSRRRRSS